MKGVRLGKVFAVVLLALAFLSFLPASAFLVRGLDEKRAEGFVEVAEKAGDRVESLINMTYLNGTVLAAVADAGLMGFLDGNVSFFEFAVGNVTLAREALVAGDYESAVANATFALSVFRGVFKDVNKILQESGVPRGQLLDAQGLLNSFSRAIERIGKLRETSGLSEEANETLDSAEMFLDELAAFEWLQDGRVSETVYNLTQANHLISEVYKILKVEAQQQNVVRMRNYLAAMEKLMEKISLRLEHANQKGVNVTEILESLGYTDEDLDGDLIDDFLLSMENLMVEAQEKAVDMQNALGDLQDMQNQMKNIEKALINNGNGGGGGNGNGNGNGNGGGS